MSSRPPREPARPERRGPTPRSPQFRRSALPPLSAGEAASVIAAIGRIHLQLLRPAQVAGLLRAATEEAGALLATRSATVCVVEGAETLRMQMGTGALAAYEGDVLPVGESLAGAAHRSAEPQRTADLPADSTLYWPGGRSAALGPALALPLVVEGESLGALLVAREPGGAPFNDQDVARVLPVADAVAVALSNARVFEQARGSREQMEAWRRETELRRWLARYEDVLADEGAVAVEWDPESGRTVWGGSAPAVFDLSPLEIGLSLEQWAERVHEDDRAAVAAAADRAAEGREELQVECRMRDGAGAFRRVELRVRPPEAEAGPLRMVGALRDLGEPEAAERGRERTGGATAERIIHALRHEINNPLAVIMGQAQLLTGDPAVQADPSLQQSVSAIFTESQRIDTLIKRLAAVEGSVADLGFHSGGGFRFPPSVLH